MKSLFWHVKRFLGIQPNMEEIKNHIKEQILSLTPAFEVEFFTYKLPKTPDDRMRLIINCHYEEEDIKLLDMFDQGQLYRVNDVERVKKFSRMNSAIVLFISYSHFVNNPYFESIATAFFLLYPGQDYNYPIRFYNTHIDLDELKGKKIVRTKELFPYFVKEGTQIENIFPRFYKPKRLTEDCCD